MPLLPRVSLVLISALSLSSCTTEQARWTDTTSQSRSSEELQQTITACQNQAVQYENTQGVQAMQQCNNNPDPKLGMACALGEYAMAEGTAKKIFTQCMGDAGWAPEKIHSLKPVIALQFDQSTGQISHFGATQIPRYVWHENLAKYEEAELVIADDLVDINEIKNGLVNADIIANRLDANHSEQSRRVSLTFGCPLPDGQIYLVTSYDQRNGIVLNRDNQQ